MPIRYDLIGGEPYLSLAKRYLRILKNFIRKHNLPYFSKKYIISNGTTIEIYAYSTGFDHIRIRGSKAAIILYDFKKDTYTAFTLTANETYKLSLIDIQFTPQDKGEQFDSPIIQGGQGAFISFNVQPEPLDVYFGVTETGTFYEYEIDGFHVFRDSELKYYGITSSLKRYFPQVQSSLFYTNNSGTNIIYRPKEIDETAPQFITEIYPKTGNNRPYEFQKTTQAAGRRNFLTEDGELKKRSLIAYNKLLPGAPIYSPYLDFKPSEWYIYHRDESGNFVNMRLLYKDSFSLFSPYTSLSHRPICITGDSTIHTIKEYRRTNQDVSQDNGLIQRPYKNQSDLKWCWASLFNPDLCLDNTIYAEPPRRQFFEAYLGVFPGQQTDAGLARANFNIVDVYSETSKPVALWHDNVEILTGELTETADRYTNNITSPFGLYLESSFNNLPTEPVDVEYTLEGYPSPLKLTIVPHLISSIFKERTWEGGQTTGSPRTFSVNDPITGSILTSREDINTENGLYDCALLDYDAASNGKKVFAIVKKVEREYDKRIKDMYYFILNKNVGELDEYFKSRRTDYNSFDSGDYHCISAYPAIAPNGTVYYLAEGAPLRYFYERDKYSYNYYLYSYVDGEIKLTPIGLAGSEEYKFEHDLVDSTTIGILEANNAKCYPEINVSYESHTTLTGEGNRIANASCRLQSDFVVYSYEVHRYEDSAWTFDYRILGVYAMIDKGKIKAGDTVEYRIEEETIDDKDYWLFKLDEETAFKHLKSKHDYENKNGVGVLT